ncbi:DUF1840 domain-containing protein [Legionella micdadei]|uniref:DUF1840 domain-containing protein n=1 Tax=Legionella micdadei TaxID=451 RepID=A0A098GHX8_LEGMI|nr:DUF1840 domain-containing protein [Legionella micdadei]ARG96989.1 hypothetical protein B6N58_04510 [Legionella micdadei]ARH00756.1 hypothetical protein B6V88_10190 [Legionella micdadei]KTD26702.1 hypothetical protein Lmic_2796 [Legionella micdadei]NSL18207.1 DUF1840 domain-containing protein [Legionella micdadei]CEG61600.1 conserved protein of unknown function [Legionella micdadei]
MLVTFSCDAYENITMFGDIAKRLLSLMGHSGTVPGAIVAEEVPEALARLEQAIAQTKQKEPQKIKTEEDDNFQDDQVSLAHRAFPLINMLKAASKNKCNVMWK